MAGPPRAWTGIDDRVSLSFGRAWRDAVQAPGLVPVRMRASGGSAVLRGPWLLRAAVRLPRSHPVLREGPAGAARWFGAIHLQTLTRLGIRGAYLHEGPCIDHWSCFAGRGPGEVLVANRKITGIAQAWRRRGALLGSATLLARPPWPLLCAAMRRSPAEAAVLEGLATDAAECMGTEPDGLEWSAELLAALRAAIARA